MWDNAAQLNRLANAIYVLVGMALGYAAVLYVMHLPVFPLREVEVTGEPKHVTYAQVSEIVKRELKGNFFTIDLPQLRGSRVVAEGDRVDGHALAPGVHLANELHAVAGNLSVG